MALLYPMEAHASHPSTPSNLSAEVSSAKDVSLTWSQENEYEGQTKPERYAIAFGMNGGYPYGVATGNVGETRALGKTYTFTCSYLKSVFKLDDCVGTFNFKVRSDNDTESYYSEWSSEVSVDLVAQTVSQEEYNALSASYAALQADYDSLTASLNTLRGEYKAALDSRNATIAGHINKIDSLNQAIANKEATINDLKAQLTAANDTIAILKKSLEESQGKVVSTEQQLKEALETLAKSKSDYELEKAKSADLSKQLAASQARVKELEAKLADVEARLDAMTAKQDTTKKQLDTARSEIDTLLKQLKDANTTISEQKSKIEQLQAIADNPKATQNLALSEEITEIALAKFKVSEKDSEEYVVALAMLAVAAEADDPDLPEELVAIPVVGVVAEQVLEVMNDLGNIGADIAPEQRERAEEIVVASVIVGNIAVSAGASAAAAGTRRKV